MRKERIRLEKREKEKENNKTFAFNIVNYVSSINPLFIHLY